MDSFLRKYMLIDTLSLKLNCNKATFIEKFKENVEPSNLSFSPFEAFSGGTKLYKGNLDNSTFKIQKKQQLFNNRRQSPIATGKIIENINDIKLDIEINGITPFMKFFFVFIVFSYLFGFTILLVISFKDTNFAFFPIPFLIVHAAFMIGIPFFIIKSSVKHFKQEMEREFHFWLR
ncbi:hypothetical protein [Flavobacterium sp. NRK F7]|uniref:hypothetical protein n=1 Tax=Flavobacterium sp. NRK F7 TaxID=2954930 RepID=UPI00209086EE|nr:hypothetical protein [Flavobacterium sp. NRK F7]MCO6162810.1 hypothetical protein [Flavobacterium sp. NRK F7]